MGPASLGHPAMRDNNLFSSFVFFLWIPITLWVVRRFAARPALAAFIPLCGAIMFLPELVSFKLPGIPAINKEGVGATWVAVGIVLWHRHRLRRLAIGWGIGALLIALPLSGIATALGNGDVQVFGPTVLSSLTPWDGVHFVIDDFFRVTLPFLIGATMCRTRAEMRDLLVVLAAAGLVYAPFILIEARLSPQLNNWIYGFAQHNFLQTIRWGGYRPMVFMNHGLAVALFVAAGLIAAAALARARVPIYRWGAGRCAFFLGWLLLICKTVSSMLYGYIGAPLAILSTPKAQMRVALALVSCLLIYPVLRLNDMVDTEALVETAVEWTDEERAQSLEFRLLNEEVLFERALERPVFGWGGFARACIFEELTGRELSTRDGAWIITLGERGAVGYILAFGLLAIPMLLARRRLSSIREPVDRALFASVTLLVGVHAFDLIPNGRYAYFSHLLAGALYGLSQGLPIEAALRRAEPKRSAPKPRRLLVDLDLGEAPARVEGSPFPARGTMEGRGGFTGRVA